MLLKKGREREREDNTLLHKDKDLSKREGERGGERERGERERERRVSLS